MILKITVEEVCVKIGTPLECGTEWWHRDNPSCFNSMDNPSAQITCWWWRCSLLTITCKSHGPWLPCGRLECPIDVNNRHEIHIGFLSMCASTHMHPCARTHTASHQHKPKPSHIRLKWNKAATQQQYEKEFLHPKCTHTPKEHTAVTSTDLKRLT